MRSESTKNPPPRADKFVRHSFHHAVRGHRRPCPHQGIGGVAPMSRLTRSRNNLLMHRDQKDSMPTGAPAMTSPPCKAGSKRASYWASASRGDTIGVKGPLPSRPRPSLADQPQYPPDVDEIGVGRSVNAIAVMEGIETGAESLHQQSDAGQGVRNPCAATPKARRWLRCRTSRTSTSMAWESVTTSTANR